MAFHLASDLFHSVLKARPTGDIVEQACLGRQQPFRQSTFGNVTDVDNDGPDGRVVQ